ncbi:MAG TPA: biopolymer transporter ExbD, partial [Candidatus Kapabacteria bacterium]|nr:biopolymer transporter ExbD [Candidatus Kapabacteria bacterium]
MRRFSSKNHLVTLNDINITPLLDLAFVLLIIFIITTPLLEQSLKLAVPTGGAAQSTVRKDEVRTIEVSPQGGYVINKTKHSLAEVEQILRAEFQRNPEVPIYIRADESAQYKNVIAVLDLCERIGIKRVRFATRPPK